MSTARNESNRVERRECASLESHRDAARIPAMDEREYLAFRRDIDRRGIVVPIELNAEGVVLDGRQRLRAARELGRETVPVRVVDVIDELEYMLRAALFRRQLSASQRAALVLELDEYAALRREASERQLANLRPASLEVATLPPRGKTRDVAARWAGVSARTLQDAATVRAHDPELFERIKRDEVSAELAARRVRRARRDRELAPPPPMPTGPFTLIYADPPWQLGNPDGPNAPENHYATMPLAEIEALEVPATEDAVLFLWTVASLRPQAQEVIAAWGFEYKSEIVWVKPLDRAGHLVAQPPRDAPHRPPRLLLTPRPRGSRRLRDRSAARAPLGEAGGLLRADRAYVHARLQARALRPHQPSRLGRLGERGAGVSALAAEALELLQLAERVARRLLALARQKGSASEDARPAPWMAIERATVYLDLPKQRLYRLTASGEIPHYKQEGRLLFHRGELDAWLARFAEGERGWMAEENES
jgi:excisionase family DNA binding protein